MRAHARVRKAVLFDPCVQGPMAALTATRPFGLLPVANRPVLHHLISRLAALGVREVVVLTASFYEDVRNYLGGGEKWGISVRCHRQRHAAPGKLAPELYKQDYTLFMGMDCWPGSLALRAFLEGSSGRSRQLLGDDGPLPCYCGDPEVFASQVADWPMVFCSTAYRLDNPANYLRANLDAMAELPASCHLEQSPDGELFLGPNCRISESARFEAGGLVGGHCKIGKSVRIGADVVIGKRVYLDRHCSLERCVILDDTYVGAELRLRNRIVDGNRVINCRTGEVSMIDDPAVLCGFAAKRREGRVARGVFRWLTAAPQTAA